MKTKIGWFEASKSIEALGWELERENSNPLGGVSPPHCRASQGGFKTLWRRTPEECLKDVQAIAEARKQPTAAPF